MKKEKSAVLERLRNAAVDEPKAVAFLESERWGDSPCCPVCGDTDVYRMMSGGQRNKDYRWHCNGCKKIYSVRYGTVLQESRLPARVWVYAIWKAASSKKGCSALQLSSDLKITRKSALFVLRRLRQGIDKATSPEQKYVARFDRLLALEGSGKDLWQNEHADEYVNRLREGWN